MPLPTSLTTLDGTPLAPEVIADKVVLFVNVASKCGLTPQYSGLVALDKAYGEKGLVIIGVPCNQFGAQEPGSPEEIKDFTKTKYDVDFTLLEKQDVNGPNRSPLYQFLVGDGEDISWNFGKFLIGRDGQVVARFDPQTKPDDTNLKAAIEKALG
ncbi:glutathione peroxidase [Synechocystis sp. PCC 6803]|jgi:glutathione peroxidase|uniref:Hydroperoxy fatty acid reductase Gpx2 n=1 Tax=Synechocystis sp. (strain ATCC 27184 / PCC 6803 / Kazusa) TaxID=1111708 RepID=GPX2_SYNY3|nr:MULTISPECIES: glutathione peroxidase [unclassified Synechocystis]P73824.1 RecName: Full=Hydroperoxy fatty acid reductase Gpx2 [Synechocystis sp. PCC 6803 substr. Kazusa]BAM51634.1 glutathione peroxidase [Synechocystis sp. PCC 6803] [Bacillus subtilis BEST7613]AGF51569.1 glutathione peroxidase [Synechocystis sp. PCC 6803]ALJ67565.1 glutathione peroxidase [Synechocystis sp. PCC 6803]AVP89409.1 glutathione peroxidase [Synechocystis sp. IPPAS B-1465]MBD2618507.1 glutathione peroxidase [Synecho